MALVFGLASVAHASPKLPEMKTPQHHCGADESVQFSCATGPGRYGSLCGRDDAHWAQFRLGPLGKPEYVFPKDGDRSVFVYGENAWASGKESSISFEVDGLEHRIAIAYGSAIDGPSNSYERLEIFDRRKDDGGPVCVGEVIVGNLAPHAVGLVHGVEGRPYLSARRLQSSPSDAPVTRIQFAWKPPRGDVQLIPLDRMPGVCTSPMPKTPVAGPQAVSCRRDGEGRDYRLRRVTEKKRAYFVIERRDVHKGATQPRYETRMRVFVEPVVGRKSASD